MKKQEPITRRTMLQTTAAVGAAAIAAPAIIAGAEPAKDPVRIGHIGIGTRGIDLIKYTGACDLAKVVAVCDVYKPHMDRGVANAKNPDVVTYKNYKDLLADPKVEAVIIACPDHWHEQMAIDASNAGKAIYCEKGLTTSVASAKKMREVVKKNKTIFQLGHQGRQWPSTAEAAKRINNGEIGEVTLIKVGRYFNGTKERAPWRWYGYYDQWNRPDPAEVLKNLDWEAWLGSAPKIAFNERHFWHWRCYWPYGSGQAGDLLSHELDHVQCVLRWGIPDTCNCTGLNAFYKDDRETPDTWLASYTFEKHDCSLTFEGCMNSGREQYPEYVGKKGRIVFNGIGQDANRFALFKDEQAFSVDGKYPAPQFVYNATKQDRWPNHMDNFLQCVRSGETPKCNIDEAFIEVVSYLMSVESYKTGRRVKWDAAKEEIV